MTGTRAPERFRICGSCGSDWRALRRELARQERRRDKGLPTDTTDLEALRARITACAATHREKP